MAQFKMHFLLKLRILHGHVLVYQCVTSDGISWSHWLLPIWTSQASRLPPLTSCSLRDISTASSSTHSPRFRLIPYRARLDTEEGMGVATNRPLQSFWCMLHAWTENLYCVCIYVCMQWNIYSTHNKAWVLNSAKHLVTNDCWFTNANHAKSNQSASHLDVSENSGTPKSSIWIGFSIINHPFWGTTIFGNTHFRGRQNTCPLLPCCFVACIVLRALRVMKFPFT